MRSLLTTAGEAFLGVRTSTQAEDALAAVEVACSLRITAVAEVATDVDAAT
jgi:hypothetical protein